MAHGYLPQFMLIARHYADMPPLCVSKFTIVKVSAVSFHNQSLTNIFLRNAIQMKNWEITVYNGFRVQKIVNTEENKLFPRGKIALVHNRNKQFYISRAV